MDLSLAKVAAMSSKTSYSGYEQSDILEFFIVFMYVVGVNFMFGSPHLCHALWHTELDQHHFGTISYDVA